MAEDNASQDRPRPRGIWAPSKEVIQKFEQRIPEGVFVIKDDEPDFKQ